MCWALMWLGNDIYSIMKRDIERILVVDVEASCWNGPPPPDEVSEIIEIGFCILNVNTGERSDKTSILVKPSRSSISPFCTELTTLTQGQADQGIPFEAACQILRKKYESRRRAWASYGMYDLKMFDIQCADFGVEFPFGSRHFNIKYLHAIAQGQKRESGMAHALQGLGLPLEGTHHRGDDDAWNSAAILGALLKRLRTT